MVDVPIRTRFVNTTESNLGVEWTISDDSERDTVPGGEVRSSRTFRRKTVSVTVVDQTERERCPECETKNEVGQNYCGECAEPLSVEARDCEDEKGGLF